jgi:PH (Pleckstrin Homology) domain-containing protein
VTTAPETLIARPQRGRTISYVLAGLIVLVFTVIALLLKGKTDSGKSIFRPEDQVAMILLGLLAAAGVLLFARPTVIADRNGLRVRNLFGWRELSWSMVAAVRFDRGNPWVTLDLADDDVIAVMAVQAVDKEYAVTAVRGLRAMLAVAKADA